jgi:hypothetical protein
LRSVISSNSRTQHHAMYFSLSRENFGQMSGAVLRA